MEGPSIFRMDLLAEVWIRRAPNPTGGHKMLVFPGFLERETGFEPATSTLARSLYQLSYSHTLAHPFSPAIWAPCQINL